MLVPFVTKLPCSLVRCLLAATVVLGACAEQGKPPVLEEDVVRLRSRTVQIPSEQISASFLKRINTAPEKRLHALVLLRQQPRLADKRKFAMDGVELLFPVSPRLWAATVTERFFSVPAQQAEAVRWIGAFQTGDKLASGLKANTPPAWAIDKDGRIRILIEVFSDVPPDAAANVIRGLAAGVEPRSEGGSVWLARVAPDDLAALAEKDIVKAIEPGPAPFQPLLDQAREATSVERLQDADLTIVPPMYRGRSGAGVQAAVFDTGIDRDHGDFDLVDDTGTVLGSRIIDGPRDLDGHGTAVAGVLAASGRRSADCTTTPYRWRGIAPQAELIAVRPDPRWSPEFYLGPAVADHGMDVSNHSYVQSINGFYNNAASEVDAIVRGDGSTAGVPIPARLMVWATSNNGVWPAHNAVEGYFAIEAPAKNGVVVGATRAGSAARDRLWSGSALGPTWDGRIKPDVVAPGYDIDTTRRDTDCYAPRDGTSIAAPMVTGILALLLEEYAAASGLDLDSNPPRPSTLKAVVIQTAKDLVHDAPDLLDDWDNPDTDGPVLYHQGPDYATGYGRIDAAAATRLLREGWFAEGSIAAHGQVDAYCLGAPFADERIQATLAWDDEPDEDRAGLRTDPNLINDLELRLIDPAGGIHLPWVLPPLTPAETAGAPDPITPADIRPAAPGEDHLNTVEQVTVADPDRGVWQLEVSVADTSVGLLETAQPYSLASNGPLTRGCPDLQVSAFEVTGPAELRPLNGSERDSPHLPVRVTVVNRGNGAAASFKLASTFSGGLYNPDRDFLVAFTPADESETWYPRRIEPLPPDASWTVEGHLVFHPSASGQSVSIRVEADSCAGDEFVPGYCRVPEGDETNNFSPRLDETLP